MSTKETMTFEEYTTRSTITTRRQNTYHLRAKNTKDNERK